MSDAEPQQNNQSPITRTTEKPHYFLVPGIILIIILIILAALWVMSHSQKPAPTTALNTASKIRQIFQVTTVTPGGLIEGVSTSAPNSYGGTVAPRGTSTQTVIVPQPVYSKINPPANPASGKTEPQIYQNSGFGFQITLPAGWQVNPSGQNELDFFNSAGTEAGYMEIYNNTSGQTLQDITTALENSPEVNKISYTTLDSQPALAFSATSQLKSGIAAVYNNKIYYLRGDLSEPNFTENFKFQ